MTRPLIDIMRDAWAKAITDGRNPRRWEINEAAKMRLTHEQKANTVDIAKPEDDQFMAPIFGIPVLKMWDMTDDPRFNLIVDEREAAGPLGRLEPFKPVEAPVIVEMNAGTPHLSDNFFGQLIAEGRATYRTTATEVGLIIDELQRRDIEAPGITEAERDRRRRAWDRNPPCPKCGSYEHFEC